MPYIVIENFNGGMDTRKLPATGTPGTLLELTNAHITRGGEIEKRKAFAPFAELPNGTFGLAATQDSLFTFGSVANPGVPASIQYQRLQHPDGHAMTALLSWDVYAGRLYVAARFSNGDVRHFYDGVIVEDWFDGRARGVFSVEESAEEAGRRSQAAINNTDSSSATIRAGSNDVTIKVLAASPDGDEVVELSDEFDVTGDPNAFNYGTAIAAAINAETADTGFSAAYVSLLLQVRVQFDELTESKDGWRTWLTIKDNDAPTGGFQANVQVNGTDYGQCSGAGGCEVPFSLTANASGGTAPYTYEWKVETMTALGNAYFRNTGNQETTAQTPVVVISAPTAARIGNAVVATIRCTVTDSTGAEVSEGVTVRTNHVSNSSTNRDGFPLEEP